MTLVELLHQCLRHFAHLDESNAAIHCASVRYSPLTFRLAEELDRQFIDHGGLPREGDELILRVLDHRDRYAEDTGR